MFESGDFIAMQEILIIEDDADLRLLMTKAIEDQLIRVTSVESLSEASVEMKKHAFSLILIDIGLPDGDGLEYFAKLKSDENTKHIPLIFLTGRNETKDKVLAFSLGAEDYLVKPIDILELRARVEAKLKKIRNTKVSEDFIRKGDLRIDVVSQKAYLCISGTEERDLPLTFSEFKLLNYLIRHDGSVLSREQLLLAVWGANVNVVDRTVDKHISSLRQKLHPRSHYIETVARSGYRFALPTNDKTDKNGKTAA